MKRKNSTSHILIVCFLLLASLWSVQGYSQKQLQVVTRSIEKSLEYINNESLTIIAEKSSISISQWDKNYILINLKLISKHPDLEVAKRELAYLEYDIKRQGNGYTLRNYFSATDKIRKVKGNLLASYTIKVPKGCNLDVTNLYGTLNLTRLTSDFKGKFKFVDVKLIDHKGKGEVESFFGDIMAENYSGAFKAKLEKSDLKLIAFDGSLDVESNYGEIEVDGGDHEKMNINGNRTKIIFSTLSIESYNYALQNTLGEIDLPSSMDTKSTGQQGVVSFNKEYGSNNDLVKISTSYSSITLKETATNNNK